MNLKFYSFVLFFPIIYISLSSLNCLSPDYPFPILRSFPVTLSVSFFHFLYFFLYLLFLLISLNFLISLFFSILPYPLLFKYHCSFQSTYFLSTSPRLSYLFLLLDLSRLFVYFPFSISIYRLHTFAAPRQSYFHYLVFHFNRHKTNHHGIFFLIIFL